MPMASRGTENVRYPALFIFTLARTSLAFTSNASRHNS